MCGGFRRFSIKNISVEDFHFSEIIVLQPVTLPKTELFHSHFSKFLITIVECYIIMVYRPCLKI